VGRVRQNAIGIARSSREPYDPHDPYDP
jgi:hypothetical protein